MLNQINQLIQSSASAIRSDRNTLLKKKKKKKYRSTQRLCLLHQLRQQVNASSSSSSVETARSLSLRIDALLFKHHLARSALPKFLATTVCQNTEIKKKQKKKQAKHGQ